MGSRRSTPCALDVAEELPLPVGRASLLAGRVRETNEPSLWRPALVLAIGAGLVALTHLLLGPNFVLEDWASVRDSVLSGSVTGSTNDIVAARPGVAVAYGLTFGLIGNHPLPIVLMLSLINIAVVVSMFKALVPLVGERSGFFTTGVWLLLPNHVSLEIWPSASMISLSLLFVALTSIRLSRATLTSRDRTAAVALGLVASLFYEASIPLLAALYIAVPVIRSKSIDVRVVIGAGVVQSGYVVWLLSNWHDSKVDQGFAHPGSLVRGLFGEAVVPAPVQSILVPVVLGTLLILGWGNLRRGWDLGAEGKMMLAGTVIVLLGFVPFARFFYTSVGAGDRVMYISSIGGAMIWVGLGRLAWRSQPLLTALTVPILLVAVLVTRWSDTQAWNRAGDDGIIMLGAVTEAIPNPDGPILLGPAVPFRLNITSFRDHSLTEAALQVAYDSPDVRGSITRNASAFERHPEHLRFDLRQVLEARVETKPEIRWASTPASTDLPGD